MPYENAGMAFEKKNHYFFQLKVPYNLLQKQCQIILDNCIIKFNVLKETDSGF